MLISQAAEGDVVALTYKSQSDTNLNIVISKPLIRDGKARVPGKQLRGRWTKVADSVAMNDIIGKSQRNWVISVKGQHYMLQDPTLAEYTACSERVVTPVGSYYSLLANY
jgi:hypothetical protein